MSIKTNNYRNFLNNVKFVLVYFVVLGHAVYYLFSTGHELLRFPFYFIYAFHMPAFVFISGYLSGKYKTFQIKKHFFRLLVPYIIFYLIARLLWPIFGSSGELTIEIITKGPLWYLLSLFYWRLLTPIFLKIRHLLLVSILLSLWVGFLPQINFRFSLSRSIVFLPFFVLGLSFNNMQLERAVKLLRHKYFYILLLLVFGLSVYILSKHVASNFMFNALPYSTFGPYSNGLVFRTLLLLAGFIGIFLITPLIPKRSTFFTNFGERSFYPYILHMYLNWYFVSQGYYDQITHWWYYFLIVLIMFLVTIFLSSRPIISLFRILFEPMIIFDHITTLFKSGNVRSSKK